MEYQSVAPTEPAPFLGKPLLRAASFRIDLNRPYLVKNLLLASQVSILVGPPNTGKSSIVACIAAHVSMGRAVGPLRVKRAAVLYVAAEDPNGIAERALGYWQSEPADLARFYIHGWPVNLADDDEMASFRAAAQKFRHEVEADRLLIVFDTLNLCIGDGDENSARDMSRVIGNAQRLARETGAHVLVVHHTSAADAGRPRGSTAMHGNVDTLLVLRRIDGQESLVVLAQEKQRSVRKGDPVPFDLGSFEAGRDEDGEIITVPIARPVAVESSLLAKVKEPRNQGAEGEARATEILRVLRTLHGKNPTGFHEARQISGMVGEAFEAVRSNPDSLRKAVRRALDALIGEGKVEADSTGFRAVSAAQPQDRAPVALH